MPNKFQKHTFVVQGARGRKVPIDITVGENVEQIALFAHGFKGYKDWGPWNLVAEEFARKNIAFVKFNFSYNGGTIEDQIDFPDLEAFGNNNYSSELADLGVVIDHLENIAFENKWDISQLALIGHSRGGGIAVLRTSIDKRINKLITWAAVSDFENRFAKGEDLAKWKDDGVLFIKNERTKQDMPLYYQFYEDFQQHKHLLDIPKLAQEISVPTLIIHGENDPTVDVGEAKALNEYIEGSELYIQNDADHVFNTKHPYLEDSLPEAMQNVVDKTVSFVKS